ncbi:hypothetical protein JW962_00620 [Candidatus Dojkabacteria bacterium]|nr:hypothetical protein [Candidatus Dojkabacteria bacterium]
MLAAVKRSKPLWFTVQLVLGVFLFGGGIFLFGRFKVWADCTITACTVSPTPVVNNCGPSVSCCCQNFGAGEYCSDGRFCRQGTCSTTCGCAGVHCVGSACPAGANCSFTCACGNIYTCGTTPVIPPSPTPPGCIETVSGPPMQTTFGYLCIGSISTETCKSLSTNPNQPTTIQLPPAGTPVYIMSDRITGVGKWIQYDFALNVYIKTSATWPNAQAVQAMYNTRNTWIYDYCPEGGGWKCNNDANQKITNTCQDSPSNCNATYSMENSQRNYTPDIQNYLLERTNPSTIGRVNIVQIATGDMRRCNVTAWGGDFKNFFYRFVNAYPTINTVQVSTDAATYYDNCNSYKTSATCQAKSACAWNAVRNKCQLYVGNNANLKQINIRSTIGHTFSIDSVTNLAYWLQSSNNAPETNRAGLAAAFMLRADNIRAGGTGNWVMRGIQYIGTGSLCSCGLSEMINKNCDNSYNGTISCRTVTNASSCNATANCGWNYAYSFCQPKNTGNGCDNDWRRYPWSISPDFSSQSYWTTNLAGSTSLCSLTSSGTDTATSGSCTVGNTEVRTQSVTKASGVVTVNYTYRPVSSSLSGKLYLFQHASDKSGIVQFNGTSVRSSWSLMRANIGPNGHYACAWNGSSWGCLPTDNDFELYVDNSAPSANITSIEAVSNGVGGYYADRLRINISYSDSQVAEDGGGLAGGASFASETSTSGFFNLRFSVNGGTYTRFAPGNIVSTTCTQAAGTLSGTCYVIVSGIGSGTYNFRVTAQDLAGNKRIATLGYTIDAPWFVTSKGDVYSGGNITVGIANNGTSFGQLWYLSSYLAYSGGSINVTPSTLTTGTSQSSFVITGYPGERNKTSSSGGNVDWYSLLKQTAELNTGYAGDSWTVLNSTTLTTNSSNGVFRWGGGVASGTYSGVKVIFVDGDLTISPDLRGANVSSGIVFIVRGNLTIGPGASATLDRNGDTVSDDYIEAAIIVSGSTLIQADTNQLVLKGTLFSMGNITLGRSLGIGANRNHPAEVFIYDPKYIDIVREYLGRINVENFSCPIVGGRSECQ